MLADPTLCPQPWLLQFHRLPYDTKLAGGKTLVQSIYDERFNGASTAANAEDAWFETKDLVEPERWQPVRDALAENARRAEVWRDSATEWMQRVSGVLDELAFVGRHPGRVEAEGMTLKGFTAELTEDREASSAGSYVACHTAPCNATTTFRGDGNVYRIDAGYFDENEGSAKFELAVRGVVRATWHSEPRNEAAGGDTAERVVVNGIRLQPGDDVTVRVMTQDGAVGGLDFLEITRDPRFN